MPTASDRRAFAATLSLLQALVACGPNVPSRDEALALLRAEPKVTAHQPLAGKVARVGAIGEECEMNAIVGPMIKDGLITQEMIRSGYQTYCLVTVTPAGQRALEVQEAQEFRMPDGMIPIYRYRRFDLVPKEVTGISPNADGQSVRVEFTGHARLTKANIAFNGAGAEEAARFNKQLADSVHTGHAELRKYDSGWRVETVEF